MAKQLSTLGVGTTFEVPVKSAYRSFLGDYVVFKMADKNHSGRSEERRVGKECRDVCISRWARDH